MQESVSIHQLVSDESKLLCFSNQFNVIYKLSFFTQLYF